MEKTQGFRTPQQNTFNINLRTMENLAP